LFEESKLFAEFAKKINHRRTDNDATKVQIGYILNTRTDMEKGEENGEIRPSSHSPAPATV